MVYPRDAEFLHIKGESVASRAENGSEEKVNAGWVAVAGDDLGLLVEHRKCDVVHTPGDETQAGDVPEPAEDIDPELIWEVFKQSHLREK